MNTHLKTIGIWIVKIAIFVIAWAYVVYKFLTMDQDISIVFTNSHFKVIPFLFVCILMHANWGLEALKWQRLIQCNQRISYAKAISGVLVGLPLALVTPNRIGEIGGRAIVLNKGYKEAVFATLLGSLTQLTATLIFGTIGAFLYLLFFQKNTKIQIIAIIAIAIIFILCCLVLYCKNKRWVQVLCLKSLGRNLFRKLLYLTHLFTSKDIVQTLIISLARYAIFSSQFGILIHMLILELSLLQIFVGITLMYLFTTIIPTSILGEIGIRGSVAMFIFESFTTDVSIIFQISLLIWIINIVLPTLIGSFLLLRVKQNK